MSENLRTAGTLPSLDMPHHLRPHEGSKYREGVTYEEEESGSKRKKMRRADDGADTWTNVDIGLQDPVSLPLAIPPNTRLTLRFPNENTTAGAEATAPTAPREESGFYWGYTVRRCSSISAVFTECEFEGGYDLSIGTSERGQPLSELVSTGAEQEATVPKFGHLVVVFGGLAGLEAAVRADPGLRSKGVVDAKDLFDFWVDVCPGQGSRTIRTEEAVWIGLMGLRGIVQGNDRR
jgi:methyltransferase